MTQKSLGQVLYEADVWERRGVRVPHSAAHINDARYERMASAVAAVVRNRHIDECISFLLGGSFLHEDSPAKMLAKEAAAGLRRLKK